MTKKPQPGAPAFVQLSHAPLVRVLCQARWPQLTKFDTKSVADQLGNAIGEYFPFCDQQYETQLTIDQTGVKQQFGSVMYRFQSSNRHWTVTLGDMFIALETLSYQGHDDFITKLDKIVDALCAVSDIPGLARLGYRYTNRLTNATQLGKLNKYFSPSILGGLAQCDDPSQVAQTVTETLFRDDDYYLIVRSAKLAPDAVIDPTIQSVPETSWLIDLDSYLEPGNIIPMQSIHDQALTLSDRASTHFRSLITSTFIEDFR